MLSILVLGTAAGGGLPQWNCGCDNCAAARAAGPAGQASQASIAVSADGARWFLVNASPDLRQQIAATPALHPQPGTVRNSPIAGVILTNGEVDAIAGLLSLREGTPFRLHAHRRVLDILDANSIFNVLDRGLVPRLALTPEQPFDLQLPDGSGSGLEVTAFAAPGKAALFLEGEGDGAEQPGDTLGLVIRDRKDGQSVVFLAACAAVTPEIAARLGDATAVFFDGTLWRDDEMIALGLGKKTGQRMGHIAMEAAMPTLAGLGIGRKYFLHINNSNPAWRRASGERRQLEAAGWHIPADGMEITL
jgi:pyrroloquinoline quinone biosynthesis protein B